MECREAGEHLADLNRGRLSPDLADAVRAHVAGCAACGEALRAEAALHALIREQAPRYAAPPAVRERVRAVLREPDRPVARRWRTWLRLHPWMAGLIAGAVAALVLVWAGSRWLTRDPVSQLVARAVAEHVEYAQDAMQRPAHDSAALLAKLRSQAQFPLGPVFSGDVEAPLIVATTAELRGKPAVGLVYRNGSGLYTTLLLMPGADAVIPAEDRLTIETFKPHHRVASGKQVLYWKQRDLACLLVSDLDEAGVAAMFLKIRKAT